MASRVPLSGLAALGGLKDLLSPSTQSGGLVQPKVSRPEDDCANSGSKETGSRECQGNPPESMPRNAESAEKSSKKAIDAEQLKALGNAAFARKDYDAAVEYYSQALDIDNENAILYANRGQALLNQVRYVSALDDANRAVSLNPTWWKAHAKRAQASVALGHFQSAVEASEEALKLQPHDSALKKYLADTNAQLRLWKSKSDPQRISFPGWEETRADILSTIDIDKQVNISLTTAGGKTVSRKTGLNYLHQAVLGGDLPLVVDIARLGAGLNVKTSTLYPCTALFLAITTKARAAENPLTPLELARAIPDLKGQALSEALEVHYYSTGLGGNTQLVVAEYLLALGADTEAKSAENDPLFPGMTPLAAAAEQRDWEACDLLLKFGADPKATVSGGSSKGRSVEDLVSGEDPNRTPESAARMEELLSGLNVVELHRGTNGQPSLVEHVSRADLDREQRERVSRFRALVERRGRDPRPPVLCRCGSRAPVLECHGRGLEGLDAGAVLRRLSPDSGLGARRRHRVGTEHSEVTSIRNASNSGDCFLSVKQGPTPDLQSGACPQLVTRATLSEKRPAESKKVISGRGDAPSSVKQLWYLK
ncbi:hypothetical protein KFL_009480040 [Klebsormidium nitens]|uniref:Uncharacterized protein n=1 Tax=Klebsormidium nitens TaxID=105231 RepID=A0A1Y1IU62_KLENI|nr:hypothetical protein KFL_009480040 [Klebsormidium nitens]|eukprot:GAQ92217.1 hypothetical protein KFL_009480040 [Klebsormidium nitens]